MGEDNKRRVRPGVTRRRVLTSGGAMAVLGLAGCSEVTEPEFEATPVILPDAAQEEFVLAETARDSETITREGPSGNVEVSITNHASVYQRGPARGTPTILEKFTSQVNGTEGPGAAIFVSGSRIQDEHGGHVWEAFHRPTFTLADLGYSIDPNQVGLILPEGARGDDGIAPGQTMTVISGEAFQREEVTYGGDSSGAVLPPPHAPFDPPPHAPFDRLMLPEVEILMDRTGMEQLPESAELIEPGEEIETEGTLFAGPSDVMVQPVPGGLPRDIYDEGVSLYGGASTFGLGALATPDASVGGESANPIVGMETEELLQGEAGRRMLARAALPYDGAAIPSFLAGPDPVATPTGNHPTHSFLGQETELQSFVGVVSSDNGPVGILTQIARATDDDHVIGASGIRRPVATPEGGMDGLRKNMEKTRNGNHMEPSREPFITDVESIGIPWEAMNQLERL